jgi:AraC-like DNA-binding protein
LLNKKDLSLTDIALETGFYSSQHYFSTFKKLTGYTPREFRKKSRKGFQPVMKTLNSQVGDLTYLEDHGLYSYHQH